MSVAKPPAVGMADISARVTTIIPPEPCLMCHGAVDLDIAADDDIRRQNPNEYERRKREAYVRGEGNPNPAVITFTTEVACMAMSEFLNRIVGFRREHMGSEVRRRFLFSEDRATSATRKHSCPVCGSSECRGRQTSNHFLLDECRDAAGCSYFGVAGHNRETALRCSLLPATSIAWRSCRE
jgi:hypothetical protein